MDTSRFIDFDEVTLRKLILEKNKYNNYPRIVYTETVFFFFLIFAKNFFKALKFVSQPYCTCLSRRFLAHCCTSQN